MQFTLDWLPSAGNRRNIRAKNVQIDYLLDAIVNVDSSVARYGGFVVGARSRVASRRLRPCSY